MNIPVKVWIRYRDSLAKVSKKAYDEMTKFLDAIGGYGGHEQEVIEFAYALATKYGEATAALACEMYDAVAKASGVSVPFAEPAATATYTETAIAVRGTVRNQNNTIPATVSRLVKQAGADTTLQNAQRDRAQFAWIPSGGTCAFCITLASRGWQTQSKKALRNGHAEHIHANCDCQYAISFTDGSEYKFYDPKKYEDMYYNADLEFWNTADGKPPKGDEHAELNTPKNRINAMRRELYAASKNK